MEASLEQIQKLGELEHWIVPAGMVNLNDDTILGKGSVGVVFGGEYCDSAIAVKLLKNPPIHNDADTLKLKSALNELRIYRRLRHQNIALFHGATLFNGQLALVLEKIRGQRLSACVCQPNSVNVLESLNDT